MEAIPLSKESTEKAASLEGKNTPVILPETPSFFEEKKDEEIVEYRLRQSYGGRLAEYLTGLKVEDPDIVERLEKDKEIIRAKYNLPPEEMKFTAPVEYERKLRDSARKLGVEISSQSNCGRFFEDNSGVGAVYFEKDKRIGINIDKSSFREYQKSLGRLEHELVHAFQDANSPRMPIELMEYEAYLVGGNMAYLKEHSEAVEVVFDFLVGGSVSHWYESEGSRVGLSEPVWNNPEFFLKNIDKLTEGSLEVARRKIKDKKRVEELRADLVR